MNKKNKNSKLTLWCLHGNLQNPSAWDEFGSDLDDSVNIHKVNLWNSRSESLWDWAGTFCKKVAIESNNDNNYLLGYSLGGRLALHALISEPSLWKGVVIVAADTGYSDKQKREKQLMADKVWSDRFLNESWKELIESWNNQSVFCGYKNKLETNEVDFDRKMISRFFNVFSKGKQEDLIQFIARLVNKPILYISGEEDKKYYAIGQSLELKCKNVKHIKIHNAGHRVPWENPEVFKSSIMKFLNLLN
jgi:2-succinyl-6-hydroxy-2,4-cyclohexadiene-1-carboxylate synthase